MKTTNKLLTEMVTGFNISLATWQMLMQEQPQSATCLATDASLTVDPGVASSIPAGSHTFVEIDHEIISMFILLPSEGLLQAEVCA